MTDAHLQYFFNKLSLMMNYKSPSLAKVLPPTDSRNRPDIRLFEDDLIDMAENSKSIIEE